MKLALGAALIVLAIAITAVAAFLRHTEILEWRNVARPRITELESNGVPVVRISGLCGNSAMAVRDVTLQRSGSVQLVAVRIFFVRRGTTGNFQVDVPVDEDTSEIHFGQHETVIWQRHPK